LAANPQVDHAVVAASEIEPATWRNIRLRMRKQHGGTLDIVLLRPLAWLAEQVDEFDQLARADSHSSALGHAVWSGQNHAGVQLDSDVGHDTGWIHLALPELGAVGPAEVLAIEPCPPLASGPGRTVTGTFAHSAADVLDLEIEGLDTPLGCTANHPFWSEDRQDFVAAGSLTIGEHLRTESGTLRQVTRITPRRGPPVAVFNLEVDAEHVYYVSTAGVLVHNTYPGNAPKSIHVGDAGHHVPAVRKSRGRPFEVERSDLSRPTIHVIGDEGAVGQAHWRMHNAERTHIGPRQGDFVGTDAELFEAYRKSYRDLHDIRVDVRSPDGSTILGRNVTLEEAVNLLETFLGGKK
jgi:hypothetical protein